MASGFALACWAATALACALAAAWLAFRGQGYGLARPAVTAALAVTALWALAEGLAPCAPAQLAEALRNLAWLGALWRLFAVDGRHASSRPVRPLIAALAFAELLQLAARVGLLAAGLADPGLAGLHMVWLLHLLVATGALVLVHNLYGGASALARGALRWPALGLAVLWGYDLNLYTVAYLGDAAPAGLTGARGLSALVLAGLLALGAGPRGAHLRFQPSRAVTFRSVSLLLIGLYLAGMVAAAQGLAMLGSPRAQALQFALVLLASAAALLALVSRRLRGWLRVTLAKHLFRHRYDYRAEWQRLTRTIAARGGPGGAASLEERIVRAVADMADSPAGLLLTPGDHGGLVLAARWQWPGAAVPAEAVPADAVRQFSAGGFIADLDAERAGRGGHRAGLVMPPWLLAEPRAWAAVPLLHFEQLVGLVVLARPLAARSLDWEDFDLLRVAGQQLASYLAEHASQRALAEAAQFDEFHRRIAFIMHDLKNLASQLALLARNAECHADNPAFRADMIVTVRNSASKLSAVLGRLSHYGSPGVGQLEPLRAEVLAQRVADGFAPGQVTVIAAAPCQIVAAAEPLEQVLGHLVRNAVEASPPGAPVFVRVAAEGGSGVLEVIDSGSGMSAEFVRSRLFRPFDSTKPGGFGIGAYEARELVRAMHGRLDVESREGLGTRIAIRLPLAETAHLLRELGGSAARKVA